MDQRVSALTAFERKVYQSETAEFADLIAVLRSTMRADPELSALVADEPSSTVESRATRLASAVVTLLLKPRITLRDREFLQFLSLSSILKNLLLSSGFRGSDPLLLQLGVRSTDDLRRLAQTNRQIFLKALLLISIDSQIDLDFGWLLKSEPKLGSLIYLGLLSSKPITTLKGHSRRERLLNLADHLDPFIPHNIDYLVLLSNAWMQCSYADFRDKHRIKIVLNKYLRRWLAQLGCVDAPTKPRRVLAARPHMVVAAEVMHSNHVQYRYFGQYLRQLRKNFHLTLVTEANQVDDHVRKLFDEVLTFVRTDNASYLNGIRDLIVRVDPDVVFWLSVGMRHWGTALANLRLAPIQFTALGHSASTFSEQIDYYLTEEGYVGDETLFGEKLLLMPDTALRFERSPHFVPGKNLKSANKAGQPIRIALPSNLLKLNPAYIESLRRIASGVSRPIAFDVFPNVGGTELLTTRRVLDEALPNLTVFPVLRYQEYASHLAECDLNLSPFPFGGLHSVIDSLRQSVPVVALEGLEPHARTDAMLLRRLGMPEWTIATSVKEYEDIAVRVIEDDDLRIELASRAAALGLDELMFGDETSPLRQEVVQSVSWMYLNHDRLILDPQRKFTEEHWRSGLGLA